MVRLTLKQCAYFLAIADNGGIAQAARALNISQPAVAQGLEKLEQLCGLRLFVRHHAKGAELTPQGRAFYRSARDLLRQAERAERDAGAISANLAGTIRFGCFHTLAPFYLARVVSGYRDAHPGVEVLASELVQEEIIAGLTSSELDLALTYDMSLQGLPLEQLVVARLQPFIIVSENHPLAGRPSLRLAELADQPLVMFDHPSSRGYFNDLLASQGVAPPIAFNARSIESVRSAVANGLGFSLSVMKPDHDETYGGGRVVSIAIAGEVDRLPIVLVRKQGQAPSGLLDSFQAFCQTLFQPGVSSETADRATS